METSDKLAKQLGVNFARYIHICGGCILVYMMCIFLGTCVFSTDIYIHMCMFGCTMTVFGMVYSFYKMNSIGRELVDLITD